MHLTHIAISNVRGFLEGAAATSFALPEAGAGWHVFAGRNGSGKSTLLRVVALSVVGPHHARHLVPSFAGWIRKGATEAHVSVKIRPEAEDWCEGRGRLSAGTVTARISWSAPAGCPSVQAVEPRLVAAPARETNPKGPWGGAWAENPTGWMVAGYGTSRGLARHASFAQRIEGASNHQRRLASLFREEPCLLDAAGWLRALHHRKLEKREGAADLLDGVLALLNNGLLPDGVQVDKVDSDGIWVRRGETVLELHALSDGYRVGVALVLDLVRHVHEAFGAVRFATTNGVRVENGGVVLIDEIDAHLHVSWQQQIGFVLKQRFPNVQFLVTTHSPFICQAASEGGLFRLPTPGEASGIAPVSDETYRKVVLGDVSQAILSELFGMDHTYSPEAVKMRTRYAQLEGKRLRGFIDPRERTELSKLKKQLPLDFPVSRAG